ncbi:MAG: hypothetical protein K6U80_02400 [Firmicutes bacterium]|nr:hypothetical protein [Bacillota bacterium]
MLLDIKPLHIEGHDCLEDLIASVAAWWNRSHELIFIESWGFYFDQNSGDIFGKRLRPVADIEILIKKQKFLEKFHGIKCIYNNTIASAGVLNFLRLQIQAGFPIICFIDMFWCPCSHGYKKRHASHTILVTGIDGAGENLFFIDPLISKKGERISAGEFLEGYESCITFIKKDLKRLHLSWRKIIQDAVRNLKSSAVFEQMRIFAGELERNVDLTVEIDNSHFIWDAPLMKRIQEVKGGRLKFILALQYLVKNFGAVKLEEACEKLKYVASRWDVVYSILVKSYLSKNKEVIAQAATKIREIADLEEDIARLLLDITNSGSMKNSMAEKNLETLPAKLPQAQVSRVVFVELKDYMNNRAFGESGNTRGMANFDGIGTYYIWKNQGTGGVLKAGEMKFKFPQPEDGAYDNISCQGQEIKVTEDEYCNIMLLGCAEMGSFIDTLTVNYSDGQSESVEFGFTNHTINNPIYGEVVACKVEGVGLDRDGNDLFFEDPVQIFAKSYILKKKGRVVSVNLPDLSNIHIFAISFGIP